MTDQEPEPPARWDEFPPHVLRRIREATFDEDDRMFTDRDAHDD